MKWGASYINNFQFKLLEHLFEGAIQHQKGRKTQSVKSESNSFSFKFENIMIDQVKYCKANKNLFQIS